MNQHFSRKFILYFILGTCIVKILYLIYFSPVFHAWEDFDIAVNLANTNEFYIDQDGIRNHSLQFPVYPFLISLIFRATGFSIDLPLFFNCFLYALTALVLYMLMESYFLFLEKKGFIVQKKELIKTITVVIFCIDPATNYYSMLNVHPFTLNMLLVFSSLACMFNYFNKPSTRRLILFSIVTGLAVLDRATAFTVVPVFLILLYKEIPLKNFGRESGSVLLIVFLVLSPWLLRNYRTDGIFSLTSTTGRILWKGSMPGGDGGNYLHDGKNYYSALSHQEISSLGNLTAKEQNDFFFQKWKEQVKSNSGHVMSMYLKKLKNFVWFRDQAGSDLSGNIQTGLIIYKLFHFLLLVLLLLALILFRKQFNPLLLFLILFMLFQSLFYVETRHRILIEPLLIFVVVAGAVWTLNKKERRLL